MRGAPKAAVMSDIMGTQITISRLQENLSRQLQKQRVCRMEEVSTLLRTGLDLH